MLRWALLLALASGGCSWILPLNDLSGDGGTSLEAAGQEGSVTPELGADVALPGDGAGPGDALSGEAIVPGDGAAVDCLEVSGCTTGWCKLATGTTAALHDLWGTGVNDLWAVGAQGTVLRFLRDKCKWTPGPAVPTVQQTQTLLAVTGDGATVFVGGTGGTLLEWTKAGGWVSATKDNVVATVTDSVRALAVADLGGTKVAFAAGGNELDPTSGFIWKRSSGVWTGIAASPTVRFHALSAGAGAVYAGGVGSLQVLDLTNEGNGFQTVSSCTVTAQQQINGVWSNGVFYTKPAFAFTAVGFDYQNDGRVLVEAASTGCSTGGSSNKPAWNDVDGHSLTDLWWVGDQGWAEQTPGGIQQITTVDLNAVWVNPDTTSPLVVVTGDKGEVWARTY